MKTTEITPDLVRQLIAKGTDALGDTNRERDLIAAVFCFRRALKLLGGGESYGEPMVAVAWDRLAFAYDLQGKNEDAETCYLRSLAAQKAADWPPQVCDDLTLLRLGQLYGRTGKRELQLAVLKRMEVHDACSCRRNAERIL